jgi:DNA topoisomerase-1
MPVVVVESPAKAKTINKYLGSEYTVLASYGHIRDLPAKDGSVDTENDFEMTWEVGADSRKHLKAIADALKEDNSLILATDPDREGEAISWHLEDALRKRRVIKKDTPVSRVVFNAITKTAVTEAMQNPRQVDAPLVEAYLARRALDYLVGFNLSPVLWRKLPGSRSAGRVQSVCLRLIVEREMEIEAFRAKEYWSVKVLLGSVREQEFEARLVSLAGQKLDKHDIENETKAEIAVQAITSRDMKIKSVEAKPGSRNPSAPFMTSTLQQEASRKFGMGARQTMNAAQRLYEAGHITYMRTDGIDMAAEAVIATRETIEARYGKEYVPKSPRMYKNKAKNAQEAHECIRPTNSNNDMLSLKLTDIDQRKLYDLIWKRTIACQMEAARLERMIVDIGSVDGQVGLRANGQVILFDGFLKVYEEGRDEPAGDGDDKRLPQLNQGEPTEKKNISPEQHFTQPPPRYTEATLVKRMEELGIGRPSTYASIVTTIQDREYVRKDQNRLIPEDKGRIVTIFLLNFFKQYVEYDFTAALETQLDHVSAGDANYKVVLAKFWKDFSVAIAETSDLRISQVLDVLDDALAPQLYPPKEDGSDPKACPLCGAGQLHLKTSRTGGFVGCGNYPECRYTRQLGGDQQDSGERVLGEDGGDEISLRSGRFGPYIQRGDVTENSPKPSRASLPKGWSASDMDLEKALTLLSLPRQIGPHPEDGEMVEAGIGRYGPFVKHGRIYANLKEVDDVFTIGMNRAVEEIARKLATRGGAGREQAKPLRELGEHPIDGGPVNVYDGRYGPYVKFGKINATLPKGVTPEAVTMDVAVALVTEKAAKKGSGKAKPKAKPKAKAKAADK